MYAIVEIGGKQFRVEKSAKILTEKVGGQVGDAVEFDRVLLLSDGKTVKVGTPTVKGAKVTAKIAGAVRGPKVLVFKKKRRKGYRKLNGHRQQLTALEVQSIETK